MYLKSILAAMFIVAMGISTEALAQDDNNGSSARQAPVSFDLDEEKLTIEADIPSVDLILSFKQIRERSELMRESFLGEIVSTAKDDPF